MNLDEFKKAVRQVRNGTYVKLMWQSEVRLTAEAQRQGYKVVKVSTGVGRLGCDYSHMGAVIRAGGSSGVLPYGAWSSEAPKYLIEHNGGYQLRVSTVNNPRQRTKCQYFVNDKVVSESELKAMGIVVNSYWSDRPTLVFNVKLENLLLLGKGDN